MLEDQHKLKIIKRSLLDHLKKVVKNGSKNSKLTTNTGAPKYVVITMSLAERVNQLGKQHFKKLGHLMLVMFESKENRANSTQLAKVNADLAKAIQERNTAQTSLATARKDLVDTRNDLAAQDEKLNAILTKLGINTTVAPVSDKADIEKAVESAAKEQNDFAKSVLANFRAAVNVNPTLTSGNENNFDVVWITMGRIIDSSKSLNEKEDALRVLMQLVNDDTKATAQKNAEMNTI